MALNLYRVWDPVKMTRNRIVYQNKNSMAAMGSISFFLSFFFLYFLDYFSFKNVVWYTDSGHYKCIMDLFAWHYPVNWEFSKGKYITLQIITVYWKQLHPVFYVLYISCIYRAVFIMFIVCYMFPRFLV